MNNAMNPIWQFSGMAHMLDNMDYTYHAWQPMYSFNYYYIPMWVA